MKDRILAFGCLVLVERAGLIIIPLQCFLFILKVTAYNPADLKKPSLGLPSAKRKESWLFFVSRCAYRGLYSHQLQTFCYQIWLMESLLVPFLLLVG